MARPSQLTIATSVLTRLIKEEASYHRELSQQQASIAKLERGDDGGDENANFTIRQERKAAEETKALFPQLKQKIEDANVRLEQLLQQQEGSSSSDQTSSPEDLAKAHAAVEAAKVAIAEIS